MSVLRIVCLLMLVPAAMAAISAVLAYLSNEINGVYAFSVVMILALLFAALRRFIPKTQPARVHDILAGVALAWLLISVLAALPFWWLGLVAGSGSAEINVFANGWNALFEAVSGFTSTGLTMSENPAALPLSLQWWRSFMQWVGGMGIVVLILSIVRISGESGLLYRAEARDRTLANDVRFTIRSIWYVYLLLTLLAVITLWLLGMSAWQALNIGMTAISTGGFVVTDNSLAEFSTALKLALSVFMLLGAISFIAHIRLLHGHWRDCTRNPQLCGLLILLSAGIPLMAVIVDYENDSLPLIDIVFQTVSALTTSGFSTADLQGWGASTQWLLTLAMLIGGSAGSTAGGIKIRRFVDLALTMRLILKRIALNPDLFVNHTRRLQQEVEHSDMTEATLIAMLLLAMWLISIALASLILLFLTEVGTSPIAILFDVTSAISTVGLSAGVAGPDLHWLGKLILIVLMWMGRLEILPVIALITWFYGTSNES